MAWIIPLLGGVRGGFLGREISVNISRITALPTPKSPPKRGLSNLIFRNFKIAIEDTVETGLKPVSTAWCLSGVRKVTKG